MQRFFLIGQNFGKKIGNTVLRWWEKFLEQCAVNSVIPLWQKVDSIL